MWNISILIDTLFQFWFREFQPDCRLHMNWNQIRLDMAWKGMKQNIKQNKTKYTHECIMCFVTVFSALGFSRWCYITYNVSDSMSFEGQCCLLSHIFIKSHNVSMNIVKRMGAKLKWTVQTSHMPKQSAQKMIPNVSENGQKWWDTEGNIKIWCDLPESYNCVVGIWSQEILE